MLLLAQGATTSTLSGTVYDDQGETLAGANVVAVHEPTGTRYGTATDINGNFRISNMRVGGPYRVTVSFAGFTPSEIENLILRLGETERRTFELSEAATELDEIAVVARAGTAGRNSGTSSQITSRDLENLPTLDRELNDFLRLTPQSSVSGSAISFAGTNNRFNAIYIDGAVNNDVFGLAASGTNGGQTGISPFSIDIVDQLQVVLSPYDVTYGGFAGGGINAVTKSGSNEFSGTVYHFLQNQSLVGKTNQNVIDRFGGERESVDDFTERSIGASISGPIIEDRLFFFTNFELQRDSSPRPFNPQQYFQGDNRASESDLNDLTNFLINNYNYNPGGFGSTSQDLDGTKFFGKLDYNISQNHRLTLRHQYTKAEQFSRSTGGTNIIQFNGTGIFFPSTTNSSAIELNSTLGNRYSNNLIVSYVRVRDDRGPIGNRFPYVSIEDGSGGRIEFGSEQFSTANQLDQDIISLTNNFEIFYGNHTITLGTHNEFYSIFNLFLRQNFGYYEFDSLQDFYNNENVRPSAYERTYAIDGTGAADFNAMQLGFYAQDEWSVNPNLTLSFGLRLDIPIITSDPVTDSFLRDTALPQMQQAYSVAGDARVGEAPQGQLMLSPRFGFEYISEFDVTFRGGAGLFTSRIPFVWPGAMFTNNGLTAGDVRLGDLPQNFRFDPDPDNQPINPNVVIPSGQVDLFTEDFKYPQIFRTNLAADFELPGNIQTTLEAMYTKTLNNITYTNVNSDPTVDFTWTGTPDNRQVFTNSRIENTYSAVYVASNTSKGYTYNLSAQFAKSFDFGLTGTLAYSFNDSYSLTEGTSSQNSSQWRGQMNINGRNNPEFGRSDFAVGHRVLASLTQNIGWGTNQSTSISVFTNIQSGGPFSYVIAGGDARNLNRETGSTSRNRSLVFVPASVDEINLIPYTRSDGTVVTPQEQWNELNRIIEDDRHLSSNRGNYAEKNGSWLPFGATIDLSVRHDIGVIIGGQTHRIQLSADIFNLANLINNSWGTFYSVRGFDNYYDLYQFEGYESDGTTPQFTYRDEGLSGQDRYEVEGGASRWRMQFGVRYLFN